MNYVPPDDRTCQTLLDAVKFDRDGLIAAIAQSASAPHDVLMLAWMNRAALEETLATGQVCYYSRSRKSLWRKGEQSGQRQKLCAARLDCDGDAVLLLVEQTGVACHTGRRSCFYHEVTPTGYVDTTQPETDPSVLYAGTASPQG
ncbi:phosphoribosyl-AMP cyclohydrolase [Swaminathania salitolerans]|uniref:Phosphoribosyl-AMP cyclohydrolase n=1 Tax=Swaminathania salitolerans TaxID=182838 RepID=A0A511BS27_9PROT|nr:phosphoribosyl-AMP cyclohydrolase [Swaminathania salitolerans]GBQ12642.1 phosphoribosyl-AMP cyclohydrolase [Swaminathania salitolerans LMG 21291]GEL03119.1 phosphoribosyl-AMP cyclohydrolase [Swaminathania salitolerans]